MLVIPITSPLELHKGPPLFPELIAASVCITSITEFADCVNPFDDVISTNLFLPDNIPLVKNLDESLNSTLIKFRNIGYTVGLVSATGSLDLSNNELTNVTVRAYKKAFTTNNIENTEYTRYPNAYSYNKNGGVTVTDVADKTTATFVAYDA